MLQKLEYRHDNDVTFVYDDDNVDKDGLDDDGDGVAIVVVQGGLLLLLQPPRYNCSSYRLLGRRGDYYVENTLDVSQETRKRNQSYYDDLIIQRNVSLCIQNSAIHLLMV